VKTKAILSTTGLGLALALVAAPSTAPAHDPTLVTAAPPLAAPGCPASANPITFASTDELLAGNRTMAGFGERPTASKNHQRFVSWISQRLQEMPGVQQRSIPYEIDRWLEQGESLEAGANGSLNTIPVSGAVPYAEPTPGAGVSGPLVYLPGSQQLAGQDLSGKIVIRDATPGSVPNAAFAALEWWSWDPDLSLTMTLPGNYERDYLAYQQRIDDLVGAAQAGAAGLVFVHGFPREQVRHQYSPYEGVRWDVPAVSVGVDEGERLKDLASSGGAARMRLFASEKTAPTETLVATLPGVSDEKIVVESHTDGMNAVWDNGPIAMLAMAKHFAALPRECRPRTLEFVFTTAHLYQRLTGTERDGGAEQYAQELELTYEQGKLALVVAMEHMGAREYAAVPRTDGPGRVLEQTGQSEPTGIFIGESPTLVEQVAQVVIGHDLRRTIALRGADLPGLHLPPHHSFGGEGTPYHKHLLPTVALVTGPWTLYNPAFGMEAIDGPLLRNQTLVFADLLHAVASIPREALAGAYLGEREARAFLCAASPDGFGLVNCADVP
jgi:hypothetical protein